MSGFEKGAERAATLWDQLDTRSERMGKQNPFRKQTDDLLKLNTQLRNGGTMFQQIERAPQRATSEVSKLTHQILRFVSAKVQAGKADAFKNDTEGIIRLKRQVDALGDSYTKTNQKRDAQGKSGGSAGGGIGNALGGLLSKVPGAGALTGGGGSLIGSVIGGAGALLGGLGIAVGAAELLTSIAEITAETEKLQKQLEVTLGSKGAADEAFELINSFASKTPHDIAGVTTAFNRLVDIGIVPTEKQLFQLSDVAVSKGKTINDYVEAIADAQTGEFERLKEFGIKASKAGDQVTFSFKGQQTTVANTAEAIDGYLLSLGDVPGIAGQTEQAGKTLSGQWSTLKDSFRAVAIEVGEVLSPIFSFLLRTTQKLIDATVNYIRKVRALFQQNGGGILGFLKTVATIAVDPSLGSVDLPTSTAKPGESELDKKRRELAEQQRKASADAKAKAAAEKAGKDAKTAATKQKQIDLDITREKEKQVEARAKLDEKLLDIDKDVRKRRLESLEKDSEAYIKLQKEVSLEEIEERRKALIAAGQEATGTPFYNRKTQKVEILNNKDYKLPAKTEALFEEERQQVTGRAQRDLGRQGEDQFDKDKEKARKPFVDAREKYEKDQANLREKIAHQSSDTELELRQALYNAEGELIRQAGESEVDYERRKNEALLSIKLDYYNKLLKLAEKDPGQKADILGLKETIAGVEKDLKGVKLQPKDGPKDIWDLLGIKFDDDADRNDKAKAAIAEATQTALDGANQLLQAQLAADQARITSIDEQLEAKKREVDIELELARQGLGNRLGVKRQEEEQLRAQRQKALQDQSRTQAIQIGLNATLQASEMALALAKTIKNFADYPFPLGILLAGAQIAGLLGLFASSVTQIRALPKYHDGDEVTHATAYARMMTNPRRADEVDARLQVGEGVIQKKSYQSKKELFRWLNTKSTALDGSDMNGLLSAAGLDIPEAMKQGDLLLVQRFNESKAQQPDTALHQRVDRLNSTVESLITVTKNAKYPLVTELADGRIRVEDERGNVRVYRPG